MLLEASHEEHQVRTRARRAATLEEALDSLLDSENLNGDERANELNIDEFEDCQFFQLSEGESEGCEPPEAETAQQRPSTTMLDEIGNCVRREVGSQSVRNERVGQDK